ncbi:MAG TPA: pyridoxamine 5'-phosphate oxidase family protein [Alphaproteobacteria bacterium]
MSEDDIGRRDTCIESEDELRALHAPPSDLVKQKCVDRLDKHCRDFIALSPFLVLGTAGAQGRADVSPRGDPPGFVKVLDDKTLLIPDRPGNNLLDSLSNIVANPEVGLLFLIPGFDETLRVNGSAALVRDPALLAPLAVEGRPVKVAIRVAVREVYLHCARSFRRARLWDPAARVPRDRLPTLAKMAMDMAAMKYDTAIDNRVEEAMKKLY